MIHIPTFLDTDIFLKTHSFHNIGHAVIIIEKCKNQTPKYSG
jgi:hypothetical protein